MLSFPALIFEDRNMTHPAVTHRRALHRIPELDNDLPETLRYVESVLVPLGAEVFSPVKGCLCAYFDAGKPETVALRADMDALPVAEMTGLPYASVHEGVMHACGHDGHTAIELALAEELARMLADGAALPRNVLFVFQPAEETTGGAEDVCRSGVFDRFCVTRVFGLHLWPKLPSGEVWSRPGPLMARSNEVTLTVKGVSVHVSRAQEGRDAMRAAVSWMQSAYAYAESLPEDVLRVLQFGHLTAGTVRNAVAGEARLEGTLRTYREETAQAMRGTLEALAKEKADATGCGFSLHFSRGYPAVWNDEKLFETTAAGLGAAAPKLLPDPVLAAEDFSFYQRAVPGVFFFLGVGDTAELHSPYFNWDDEAVLPKGVDFMKKLMLLA